MAAREATIVMSRRDEKTDPNMLETLSVNLATEVAKGIGPKLLAAAAGKRLLIIGQNRAGKSSLRDAFVDGKLLPEQRTRRTRRVETSWCLTLQFGQRKVRFRGIQEIPGELKPEEHGREVWERKPHLCVVVIDQSTQDVYKSAGRTGWRQWFDRFGAMIHRLFVHEPSSAPGFLVLLNKRDKSRTPLKIQSAIEKLAEKHIERPIANSAAEIPVLHTILVAKEGAAASVDAAILTAARMLAT